MTTIREVAHLVGVSATTVSHVINETRYVSPEVRERVQQAIDQLGYRPNALARSLRRGETLTLGLILPDSTNPFFSQVGHAIETAAFHQGYNVILCNTEGDLEKEAVYTDVLCKKQIDGIIFISTGDQPDTLQDLLRQRIPVVVVDRDLLESETDAVLIDNLTGGYQATRHLIENGHQRIACITGPSYITPSAQRLAGYRQAAAEANLSIPESFIILGDFHPDSGYEATRKLLERSLPPTAIFACNDMMAMGAIRAATEQGLRIPDNLSLVGFDDIELASFVTPPLTTISQPKDQIGQLAVQFLVERINEPALSPRREVLPTSLIIRQSTRRINS